MNKKLPLILFSLAGLLTPCISALSPAEEDRLIYEEWGNLTAKFIRKAAEDAGLSTHKTNKLIKDFKKSYHQDELPQSTEEERAVRRKNVETLRNRLDQKSKETNENQSWLAECYDKHPAITVLTGAGIVITAAMIIDLAIRKEESFIYTMYAKLTGKTETVEPAA